MMVTLKRTMRMIVMMMTPMKMILIVSIDICRSGTEWKGTLVHIGDRLDARSSCQEKVSLIVSHPLLWLFCSPLFIHDDVLICVATQVVPMVQGNCCHVEDPKTLNDVETKWTNIQVGKILKGSSFVFFRETKISGLDKSTCRRQSACPGSRKKGFKLKCCQSWHYLSCFLDA